MLRILFLITLVLGCGLLSGALADDVTIQDPLMRDFDPKKMPQLYTDCCIPAKGVCVRKMCINICDDMGGIRVNDCHECKK